MDPSSATNVVGVALGPYQPPNVGGPVGARGSQHGPGVPHPGQPGEVCGAAHQAMPRLAQGLQADDVVAPIAGKGPGNTRNVGVLGVAPTTSDSAIHRQEETAWSAECLMRPTDLVRVLNSSGFGEVINMGQLYRHRKRAGVAVARGRKVDFLAYAGWLTTRRHAEKSTSTGQEPVNPADILRLLGRQAYRCALTGRELNPDSTALDHIVPVSRGGRHVMGNVQALDKPVNRAKGTLTNDEFIQLCREVVAHADDQNPSPHTEVHHDHAGIRR